jgi:signal transduction histidine kinase
MTLPDRRGCDYRLVQEALTNVLKHAVASHADVIIREDDEVVRAVVSDNGNGFDPASELAGFGLVGMRERVALLEGRLTLESASGVGTTVRAELPVRRVVADRKLVGG